MPKFIVAKEPLALWYQPGEEVEIKDEQAVRNLLRDGRINVPEEKPEPAPPFPVLGEHSSSSSSPAPVEHQ